MIHLQDLHLTYRGTAAEVHVLRGITLSIARGETVSLVGPSGSGKTSLLMVSAGLERSTGGRIEVAGQDIGRLDEDGLAEFRRDRIGIVFQDFHLIPTMTARENVAVPLEFAGRSEAFERAAEVLADVGLDHRLDHYPGQLSGGEQQRVALARAFATSPDLLLADEPTGNLDGETGGKVIDLLFSLQRTHNTTLLLITHDPALAERCERRIRIADGEIVSDQYLEEQADDSSRAASRA
ncbi:ABC transporter ATP-binding protein [Fodinicurvata fenggangensis]|uniref:ABC transporter ATP-binding protein n=1 Tax=Fodinicurvata fenggangensis TaxID=1121830 RepID=UPI000551D58A|nr:ABC transporter ATP-binding protein [Fodinicurvata fenggangensis]